MFGVEKRRVINDASSVRVFVAGVRVSVWVVTVEFTVWRVVHGENDVPSWKTAHFVGAYYNGTAFQLLAQIVERKKPCAGVEIDRADDFF